MFTDNPIYDFERYDREQCERECYCYKCERTLKNERVLKINDNYYCFECADDWFGEEV